jgi:hypothetical protein
MRYLCIKRGSISKLAVQRHVADAASGRAWSPTAARTPGLHSPESAGQPAPKPASRRASLALSRVRIRCNTDQIRWGCIRRITWWINRGYRLERHPRQSARLLDGPAVRGSAGLPDSLGDKRDITSGRGCVSSVDRCLASGPRDCPSLSTHSHLIQVPRVTPVFRCPALCGRSRVPVTHRRNVAHLARIADRGARNATARTVMRTGKRATPCGKESWKEARTVIDIQFESSYIGHVTGKPENPRRITRPARAMPFAPVESGGNGNGTRKPLRTGRAGGQRRPTGARDADRDRFPDRHRD